MKESFAGRGALKHSAAVDSAPRRKGVDRRRHRFIQCLLRMASLLLAVAAVGAAAIPVAAARSGQRQPEYSTFEQLGGKTISMLTGAPFEELIGSKVPDVGEFTYYSAPAELLLALRTGKTDAFLNNSAIAALYVNKYKDIAQFPEPLKEAQFGVGFSKKYKKLAEWKKAFAELDPDEIEAVWNKWTSADESKKLPLKQDWAGKAGKVRVAVGDSMQPASYVNAAGDVLGMEAEIILMMAKKLDYKVEFMPMEFASLKGGSVCRIAHYYRRAEEGAGFPALSRNGVCACRQGKDRAGGNAGRILGKSEGQAAGYARHGRTLQAHSFGTGHDASDLALFGRRRANSCVRHGFSPAQEYSRCQQRYRGLLPSGGGTACGRDPDDPVLCGLRVNEYFPRSCGNAGLYPDFCAQGVRAD